METSTDHPTLFSRRVFIKQSSLATLFYVLPSAITSLKTSNMKEENQYEVVIIGGSYSGLAAAMALGRAMRKVLVIDAGKPCNIQTPKSHNFLTQDGVAPFQIASISREQVQKYDTVSFMNSTVVSASKINNDFELQTNSGKTIRTSKLVFATGIKDEMSSINGFSECWGISVLHCPYCHGYEVKALATGIMGNGENGFELAKLISNWTKDLTVFTNGPKQFSNEQLAILNQRNIQIEEKTIKSIDHNEGCINQLVHTDNTTSAVNVIYARVPFTQNSALPKQFGCDITEEGYIKVDAQQRTSIHGIYACGDNSSRMRTVASAVSSGTTAGMMLNKEMIEENFKM